VNACGGACCIPRVGEKGEAAFLPTSWRRRSPRSERVVRYLCRGGSPPAFWGGTGDFGAISIIISDGSGWHEYRM